MADGEAQPLTQIQRVLSAVRSGATTSDEVSRATGLTRGYASSYMSELARRGEITVVERDAVRDDAQGRAFHIYSPEPRPKPPEPVKLESGLLTDLPEREVLWVPNQVDPRLEWKRTLLRPRYGPGCWMNMRLHWQPDDLELLRYMMELRTSQRLAADVLGRSPPTLVTAIYERRWEKPDGWLWYPQKYVKRERAPPLLSYPYINKVRTEHGDILAVNTLVARFYPEHMRADVCQDIMLAMLEGEITLEQLRARGVKTFVSQYRKKQDDPYGTYSLDVPRNDGRSWHELLSSEQLEDEYDFEDAA